MREIISIAIACAIIASWSYWIIAWWCTRRFFTGDRRRVRFSARGSDSPGADDARDQENSDDRDDRFDLRDSREQGDSRNQGDPRDRGDPRALKRTLREISSISILKPVKGVDARAMENFLGFCDQDYPQFDLLFGVADANDPAAKLVEQLASQRPDRRIRLIVAPITSANPKSSTLQRLTDEASGDVLVISDADIRVTPDYLARVVGPLVDPAVGIVTCLYRGANARTLFARLEALHMAATFLPSVVLAHELLGQCVGMGATLALRKADLQRLGGYASFADHLMDDYQLAERVQKLGLKIHLSDYVVQSVLGNTRFSDQWARELRWARGIRITTPGKYPGLLLTYPIVLSQMLVALHPLKWYAWGAVAISIILRAAIAWSIESIITPRTSEARTRIGWNQATDLHLLGLREILSFAVWCAGLFGRTIIWRGQKFTLRRDGKLLLVQSGSRLTPSPGTPGEGWGGDEGRSAQGIPESNAHVRPDALDRIVRRLDAFLRRRQNIFEYSASADCIFRASVGDCESPTRLVDGTMIEAGERVCDLHLWNERLPRMPLEGASLAWAHQVMQMAQQSLRLLAEVIENDVRFEGITAIRARSAVTPRGGVRQLQRFADRMHFELREPPARAGFWSRLHDLGENLLLWALVRTFNPGGLRGAKLMRRRSEFWISRRRLMVEYGSGGIEGREWRVEG
jgi:ceramide glucosyltransferase